MSGRLAVFAYGSLVSRASVEETLERAPGELVPARLRGWRRDWSLARDNLRAEKRFARADGTLPGFCLALNLVPDAQAPAPNGALIELAEAELERLDLRELRYDRVDVSGAVESDGSRTARIFTYVAKPEHHRPSAPPDSVIVAAYPAAIEAAFSALGDGELDLYRGTTAPLPVEPEAAKLVADAIPPGNPRRW